MYKMGIKKMAMLMDRLEFLSFKARYKPYPKTTAYTIDPYTIHNTVKRFTAILFSLKSRSLARICLSKRDKTVS